MGEAVLSRDKARREESWVKLEKNFEADERVEGLFSAVSKAASPSTWTVPAFCRAASGHSSGA